MIETPAAAPRDQYDLAPPVLSIGTNDQYTSWWTGRTRPWKILGHT